MERELQVYWAQRTGKYVVTPEWCAACVLNALFVLLHFHACCVLIVFWSNHATLLCNVGCITGLLHSVHKATRLQ